MLWLKLMGIGCIFSGCVLMGHEKTYLLRKRIETLREMSHGFVLFKGMTMTYRLPLSVVFGRIQSQLKTPVSEFYRRLSEDFQNQEAADGKKIWENAVNQMEKVFDQQDMLLFLNLGDFIGVQDVRMQGEAIDDCIEQLKERIHLLETERPKKEKLYQVLSFTVSGFLILLFI